MSQKITFTRADVSTLLGEDCKPDGNFLLVRLTAPDAAVTSCAAAVV